VKQSVIRRKLLSGAFALFVLVAVEGCGDSTTPPGETMEGAAPGAQESEGLYYCKDEAGLKVYPTDVCVSMALSRRTVYDFTQGSASNDDVWSSWEGSNGGTQCKRIAKTWLNVTSGEVCKQLCENWAFDWNYSEIDQELLNDSQKIGNEDIYDQDTGAFPMKQFAKSAMAVDTDTYYEDKVCCSRQRDKNKCVVSTSDDNTHPKANWVRSKRPADYKLTYCDGLSSWEYIQANADTITASVSADEEDTTTIEDALSVGIKLAGETKWTKKVGDNSSEIDLSGEVTAQMSLDVTNTFVNTLDFNFSATTDPSDWCDSGQAIYRSVTSAQGYKGLSPIADSSLNCSRMQLKSFDHTCVADSQTAPACPNSFCVSSPAPDCQYTYDGIETDCPVSDCQCCNSLIGLPQTYTGDATKDWNELTATGPTELLYVGVSLQGGPIPNSTGTCIYPKPSS
jgi:hypothetical protein